jgi:hypothetical protein
MNEKLSVGDTLSEVFSIYKDNAGVLLPVAFWLFLAVAVVSGLLLGTNLWLLALVLAFQFAVATLYQGTVVELVNDVQDGRRDSSAGDLLRSAAPFILPLIGVGVFAGICVGLGLLLFIVPGLILMTIWAVVAPVIVVEKAGVFESLGRSRELVRGNAWEVFGVIVVTFIIVFVASMIFGAIADAIADGPLLRIVFSALASTLTAPIGALVASVIYFRLRAIKQSAPAAPAAPAPAETPLPPAP